MVHRSGSTQSLNSNSNTTNTSDDNDIPLFSSNKQNSQSSKNLSTPTSSTSSSELPPPPPLRRSTTTAIVPPNFLLGDSPWPLKKITRSASERLSLDTTFITEKLRLTNDLKRSRTSSSSNINNTCSKSVDDLNLKSAYVRMIDATEKLNSFKFRQNNLIDCVHDETKSDNLLTVPSPAKSVSSTQSPKKINPKGTKPLTLVNEDSSKWLGEQLEPDPQLEKKTIINDHTNDTTKPSNLVCRVSLERLSGIIDSLVTTKQNNSDDNGKCPSPTGIIGTNNNKTLCLYCDRTFSSQKLYAKHSERVHQASEGRRLSARKTNACSLLYPGCSHCNNGKTTSLLADELPALFHHLIDIHFDRYFACKECIIRFPNKDTLLIHMDEKHTESTIKPPSSKTTVYKSRRNVRRDTLQSNCSSLDDLVTNTTSSLTPQNVSTLSPTVLLSRSSPTTSSTSPSSSINATDDDNDKSAEPVLRSSRRQQAKLAATLKNSNTTATRKKILRSEETTLTRLGIAQNRSPRTRRGLKPRPIADSFRAETPSIKLRKNTRSTNSASITQIVNDVSENSGTTVPTSSQLTRTSGGTKADTMSSTFDERFYESVNLNVRQNLSCHIDGKLESGPMSPTPVAPVDAFPTVHSTLVKSPMINDNEIHEATALSALTAFPTLLTAQQYGADPVPLGKIKKPITKNSWKWKWDCVKKYKYVNEGGKFVKKIKQPIAGIRDLSKLDMWTQLTMRTKHEVVRRNEQEATEEQQLANVGEVARDEKRRLIEQLNNILDKRILPQINLEQNDQRVIKIEQIIGTEDLDVTSTSSQLTLPQETEQIETMTVDDLPSLLQLQRKNSSALKQQTELVLSGEWARPRCYICCGCGGRFETIKLLEEHKASRHPYVYSTHYEIVGKELIDGNLFRHFYIPSTALQRHNEYASRNATDQKENIVEDSMDSVASYPMCYSKSDSFDMDSNSRNSKVSTVSSSSVSTNVQSLESGVSSTGDEASGSSIKAAIPLANRKVCSKCNRDCNGLLELYRHMLDCSNDYVWLQAKKRQNIKYRYFGSRKRRVHRNNGHGHRRPIRPKKEELDTPPRIREPQQPKPRPSDAESIQRMLANLPAKRACRQIFPNVSQQQKRKLVAANQKLLRGRKQQILIKQTTNGKSNRRVKYVTTSSTRVSAAVSKNIQLRKHQLATASAKSAVVAKQLKTSSESIVRKTRSTVQQKEPIAGPSNVVMKKKIVAATTISTKKSDILLKAIRRNTQRVVTKIKNSIRRPLHRRMLRKKSVSSANLPNVTNYEASNNENKNVESISKKQTQTKLFKRTLSFRKSKRKENSKNEEVIEIDNKTKDSSDKRDKIVDDKLKDKEVITETIANAKNVSTGNKTIKTLLKGIKNKCGRAKTSKISKSTKENIAENVDAKEKVLDNVDTKIIEHTEINETTIEIINSEYALSIANSLTNDETSKADKIAHETLQLIKPSEETIITANIIDNINEPTNIAKPKETEEEISQKYSIPLIITTASDFLSSPDSSLPNSSTVTPCTSNTNLSSCVTEPIKTPSPIVRRRARKLNDCIAMLTGKLQEKLGVPFLEKESSLLMAATTSTEDIVNKLPPKETEQSPITPVVDKTTAAFGKSSVDQLEPSFNQTTPKKRRGRKPKLDGCPVEKKGLKPADVILVIPEPPSKAKPILPNSITTPNVKTTSSNKTVAINLCMNALNQNVGLLKPCATTINPLSNVELSLNTHNQNATIIVPHNSNNLSDDNESLVITALKNKLLNKETIRAVSNINAANHQPHIMINSFNGSNQNSIKPINVGTAITEQSKIPEKNNYTNSYNEYEVLDLSKSNKSSSQQPIAIEKPQILNTPYPTTSGINVTLSHSPHTKSSTTAIDNPFALAAEVQAKIFDVSVSVVPMTNVMPIQLRPHENPIINISKANPIIQFPNQIQINAINVSHETHNLIDTTKNKSGKKKKSEVVNSIEITPITTSVTSTRKELAKQIEDIVTIKAIEHAPSTPPKILTKPLISVRLDLMKVPSTPAPNMIINQPIPPPILKEPTVKQNGVAKTKENSRKNQKINEFPFDSSDDELLPWDPEIGFVKNVIGNQSLDKQNIQTKTPTLNSEVLKVLRNDEPIVSPPTETISVSITNTQVTPSVAAAVVAEPINDFDLDKSKTKASPKTAKKPKANETQKKTNAKKSTKTSALEKDKSTDPISNSDSVQNNQTKQPEISSISSTEILPAILEPQQVKQTIVRAIETVTDKTLEAAIIQPVLEETTISEKVDSNSKSKIIPKKNKTVAKTLKKLETINPPVTDNGKMDIESDDKSDSTNTKSKSTPKTGKAKNVGKPTILSEATAPEKVELNVNNVDLIVTESDETISKSKTAANKMAPKSPNEISTISMPNKGETKVGSEPVTDKKITPKGKKRGTATPLKSTDEQLVDFETTISAAIVERTAKNQLNSKSETIKTAPSKALKTVSPTPEKNDSKEVKSAKNSITKIEKTKNSGKSLKKTTVDISPINEDLISDATPIINELSNNQSKPSLSRTSKRKVNVAALSKKTVLSTPEKEVESDKDKIDLVEELNEPLPKSQSTPKSEKTNVIASKASKKELSVSVTEKNIDLPPSTSKTGNKTIVKPLKTTSDKNTDKKETMDNKDKLPPPPVPKPPRKKRKNELAQIIADQLLESFKEVDQSRIEELKLLHDLSIESSEDLLLSAARLSHTPPPKRRTVANIASEALIDLDTSLESTDSGSERISPVTKQKFNKSLPTPTPEKAGPLNKRKIPLFEEPLIQTTPRIKKSIDKLTIELKEKNRGKKNVSIENDSGHVSDTDIVTPSQVRPSPISKRRKTLCAEISMNLVDIKNNSLKQPRGRKSKLSNNEEHQSNQNITPIEKSNSSNVKAMKKLNVSTPELNVIKDGRTENVALSTKSVSISLDNINTSTDGSSKKKSRNIDSICKPKKNVRKSQVESSDKSGAANDLVAQIINDFTTSTIDSRNSSPVVFGQLAKSNSNPKKIDLIGYAKTVTSNVEITRPNGFANENVLDVGVKPKNKALEGVKQLDTFGSLKSPIRAPFMSPRWELSLDDKAPGAEPVKTIEKPTEPINRSNIWLAPSKISSDDVIVASAPSSSTSSSSGDKSIFQNLKDKTKKLFGKISKRKAKKLELKKTIQTSLATSKRPLLRPSILSAGNLLNGGTNIGSSQQVANSLETENCLRKLESNSLFVGKANVDFEKESSMSNIFIGEKSSIAKEGNSKNGEDSSFNDKSSKRCGRSFVNDKPISILSNEKVDTDKEIPSEKPPKQISTINQSDVSVRKNLNTEFDNVTKAADKKEAADSGFKRRGKMGSLKRRGKRDVITKNTEDKTNSDTLNTAFLNDSSLQTLSPVHQPRKRTPLTSSLNLHQYESSQDTILSEIVNKIRDEVTEKDRNESDEDLCLAEIAKSLNNKMLDEFSNDGAAPIIELSETFVARTDFSSLATALNANIESSTTKVVQPVEENNVNTGDHLNDLFIDQDENTNTELVDMDLEDTFSVYTSFSIDTNATKNGIKRKRRYRRSILMKSNRKAKKDQFALPGENHFCEICNKTFTSQSGLASHRTTLKHISKLSETEFLNASQKPPSSPEIVKVNIETTPPSLPPIVFGGDVLEPEPKVDEIADDVVESQEPAVESAVILETPPSPGLPSPVPPVIQSPVQQSPYRTPTQYAISPARVAPLSYLNQSGIEPISSPEQMEYNQDRYNIKSRPCLPPPAIENSRLALSQEERLFYECCSMLKGSDRSTLPPANTNSNHQSPSKYYPMPRINNAAEMMTTKPVTPKSNEQYSYVVPEGSKHSKGIPKIDLNQFSDISSDSNPAYSCPQIPSQAETQNLYATNNVETSSREHLFTSNVYASSAIATTKSYEPILPIKETYAVEQPQQNAPSIGKQTVIDREYTDDHFSDMGDSFPSSHDASENEIYVQTLMDRSSQPAPPPSAHDSYPSNYLVGNSSSGTKSTHFDKLKPNLDVSKSFLNRSPIDSPLHSTSSQSSTMSRPRTKAAMKGYENFKVSIPTTGIDLQQALNRSPNPGACKLAALADIALGNDVPHAVGLIPSICSPVEPSKTGFPIEKVQPQISKPIAVEEKPVEVKKRKPTATGNKLGFNQRKKKATTTAAAKATIPIAKVQLPQPKDIYDFEDSRDSSNDGPIRPMPRPILPESIQPVLADAQDDSQVSSYSDRDDYNYEDSVTDSDSSGQESHASSAVTKRSVKSINNVQKKCLIMGRIFKSVKKLDQQPKEAIVAIDKKEVKKPIPKQELDKMFDSLRSGSVDNNTVTKVKDDKQGDSDVKKNIAITASKSAVKKTPVREKSQVHGKGASGSSDKAKRSCDRRSRKPREIANLEAEWNMSMDEIIKIMGVAPRKTQRRCAANKQRTFAETWSSDEYEEFHTTKDIIALIEEAETKAQRSRSRSAKNGNKKLEECPENIGSNDLKDDQLVKEDGKTKDGEKPETSAKKKPTKTVKKATRFARVSEKDVEPESDIESAWSKRTNRAKITNRRRTIAFKEDDEQKSPKAKEKLKAHQKSSKSKTAISATATPSASSSSSHKPLTSTSTIGPVDRPVPKLMPRRKRVASEMLYYWSSSSDEEFGRIKPRDNFDDDNLEQHGWIVGDSHKKLVTLLAHAKGKKIEDCGVKETGIHKKKT